MSLYDTHVPLSNCPACNAALDAAARPNANDTVRPVPGDFSLCMQCATPLRFGDDMQLRMLNEQDILDAPLDEFAQIQRQLRKHSKKTILAAIAENYDDS